jgi:release factor glutamine methyltransferase
VAAAGRRARGDAVAADAAVTVLDVLKRSTEWLKGRGIENPRLDAELLVAHGLSLRRLDLYLQFARVLTDGERARVRELVRARGDRTPVAYLVGEREFHGLPFLVDRRVLVPRPETELLVDVGIDALRARSPGLFADVGTGSGCVAVSVLRALPAARGHATDVSAGALEVAARNAERHGVADRLALHRGDLLGPLAGHPDFGRLDAVLSNPPYVVRDDPTVEPDVALHEPPEALYVGGGDPLEVVRRVAEAAHAALREGGLLALEVGAGSAGAALAMLADLGYRETNAVRDLSGIDRVVTGRRP